ncbi:MAG: DUF2071 domain-containing protein [Verrucomicrobiota bacterium JB022]|nr:DUF2071 domain-containing protein [Verrucomicrobiota bacterium JB022]
MSLDLDVRLAARQIPENAKPAMYQRWVSILFAHWAIEPEEIQRTLPSGLQVDTYDSKAWLALVPFFMRDVQPTWAPAVPVISNFLELNVRTYVIDAEGKPAVWFYSLDCNQRLAVLLGRQFFHLPYEVSRIKANEPKRAGDWIDYQCQRRGAPHEARYRYRGLPVEPVEARPGSLEFFLLERYYLISEHEGRFYRGQVAHEPYRFRPAELERWDLTPLAQARVPAPVRPPDHVCYIDDVRVKAYKVEPVRG